MERSFRLVTAATGLLVLLAAATVAVAYATPTSASGCAQIDVMKTVFPKAGTVGFKTRWRIRRATDTRGENWPGWCGDWRTAYTDSQPLRPYNHRAFAEVGVSLYKTHRDALAALAEPAYGPTRTLANGALVRTLVSAPSVNGDASRQVGEVASVVGNVFISSQGQGRPPAYRGKEAVRAQMRIHRRIQAAVLRLRLQTASASTSRLTPPQFAPAAGWHVRTGTVHECAGNARCLQVTSTASTTRFRDCVECLPQRTAAAMHLKDIAIQITIFGPPRVRRWSSWPLRVSRRSVHSRFKGLPERIGVYFGTIRAGARGVDVMIVFGRAVPTNQQLNRANAELQRARLG